jgi:uncharacterized protein
MNKVVHFEIPFDDKEKCIEFYKNVFGWEFQDMPEMKYVIARTTEVDDKFMIKEPGAINGGMYKRGEGAAKGPVIVIDVEDVDEYVKKVEDAGGEVVMEKRQVGEMGWYAQVKDVEGNIIGLWEIIHKHGEGNPPESGDSGSD